MSVEARDYKGRLPRKKTHRRYEDSADRPDLRALALCCDLRGPVIDETYLTSDPAEVTCGSCQRIMNPKWTTDMRANPPSRPYSDRDYRRMTRLKHPPAAVLAKKAEVERQREWKLPNGFTLTICGDVLQVCDASENEIVAIDAADVSAWTEALAEAENEITGAFE